VARIRTIKPEFWTDERIGEVSVSARLLLIGSLNFADDEGGLERSSKQLKAQIFPYDSIDCEPLVLELLRVGLFIEYEVADRKYLHIKGFSKHQKVENKAKPRIPVYDPSVKTIQPITESSPSPHREIGEEKLSLRDQGREGIKEGKGSKEQGARERALAVPGLDLKAWEEWQAYRAERKPAIKLASLVAAAEELAAFKDQQAIVVKHSIANGYQGLFAPKTGVNGTPRKAFTPAPTTAELEALEAARGTQ